MRVSPNLELQALEAALAKFEDPFLLVIPEGGEAVPILDGND